MNIDFLEIFVIVIVFQFVRFSILYFNVFDDLNFEKIVAFFLVNITFTLIFLEFDFVNFTAITNKLNFINFSSSLIDFRTKNNQFIIDFLSVFLNICFDCLSNKSVAVIDCHLRIMINDAEWLKQSNENESNKRLNIVVYLSIYI